MTSQALLKVLTTPSKIASALDWKKMSGSSCLLNLDIHKDRIELAFASHPSFQEPLVEMEPLPLGRKSKLTDASKQRLAQLMQEQKVCGIVVSWPMQSDTGRMGASCGRVLHTLESLLEDSTTVLKNKPVCLWDSQHSQPDAEDEWGRCVAYSRTSSKTEHRASQEQYQEDENAVVSQVWDDFFRAHWPDIYQATEKHEQQEYSYIKSSSKSSSSSLDNLGDWEDSSSYVHAAAF